MQYPLVPRQGGTASALNISATTVIKATPGTIFRVCIVSNATSGFGVYDANTVAGAVAANAILLAATTTEGQVIELEFPCANGIVVAPGATGIVSVSYT
jgi:hypothetical protein